MKLFRQTANRLKTDKSRGLSLKTKLVLSLSSIAVVLLVSSIITIMEYDRMSTYMSDLITEDINSVTLARSLADDTGNFNLQIMTVIGDDDISYIPYSDIESFMSHCDSLKSRFPSTSAINPLADSIVYAYSAYMLTAMELPKVVESDFIDSRTWYFERLQPKYNRLRTYIDGMNSEIHDNLKKNSEAFDKGFYRSIIPGVVAVGIGLLLLLLLLYFMLSDYVNPLNKMLSGLNNYRSFNKKYNLTFDGDDQLSELNDGIVDLTGENQQLRKRIAALRNAMNLKGNNEE